MCVNELIPTSTTCHSSTIYVPQDYAGAAFNNTCFTKEENSINVMERITMLLTGECCDDI